MSHHSNKILVKLTIKGWSGKSIDADMTNQSLALFNGRTGDGSFTKVLVHEDYMRDLKKASTRARAIHDHHSLPWLSKGIDIITSKSYHDYVMAMAEPIEAFKKAKEEFCNPDHYSRVVEAQKSRLKTAWNILDYPTPDRIGSLFDISVGFFPFPDAKDWRLDLAEEEAELIRKETELSIKEAIYDASKDAINRYLDALTRFADKMRDFGPGNRMHKTIITNLKDLADILPKLNISDDPRIDIAAVEIKSKLEGLNLDVLKEDKSARDRARDEALEIIKRLSLQ